MQPLNRVGGIPSKGKLSESCFRSDTNYSAAVPLLAQPMAPTSSPSGRRPEEEPEDDDVEIELDGGAGDDHDDAADVAAMKARGEH